MPVRKQTPPVSASHSTLPDIQHTDLGIALLNVEDMKAAREDGERYTLNVLDLNREPALLHPTKGLRPGDTWEGIILHNHPGRERRTGTYEADNPQPPDCTSWDGVTGYGTPGGNCATCPCAQRGGDCMPVYHLFVLPVEGILPVHVRVPVTSGRAVRKFVDQSRFTRGPLTSFVTVFGAEEKGEGSVLTLEAGQKLSKDAARGVKAYAELVRSVLEYPTPVGQAAERGQLADPTARPRLGPVRDEAKDLDRHISDLSDPVDPTGAQGVRSQSEDDDLPF